MRSNTLRVILDTQTKLTFGSPLLIVSDRESKLELMRLVSYPPNRLFKDGITIAFSNSGIVIYREYIMELIQGIIGSGHFYLMSKVLIRKDKAFKFSIAKYRADLMDKRDHLTGLNRLYINEILANTKGHRGGSRAKVEAGRIYDFVADKKSELGDTIDAGLYKWVRLVAGREVSFKIKEQEEILWSVFSSNAGRDILRVFEVERRQKIAKSRDYVFKERRNNNTN